ncbi:MAG: retropepsin-like aspartic protease, partial [Bacteroidia bacterium]|nr:retropepsin-like aspartic protease [Bacteroidia bacterium]
MRQTCFYSKAIALITIFTIILSSCASKKMVGPFVTDVKTFPAQYHITLPYTNHCKTSPIVQLSINGKIRNFIFDTGATMIISEKLYQELELSSKDTTKITDAAGNTQKTPYTYIPEIKMEDVSFFNIPTYILKKQSNTFWDFYDVDGVVGSNLFHNSIVKITSKDKTITLSNSADIIPKDIKPLKISYSKFQKNPHVMLKCFQGNRKANIEVLFDTGYNGLIDIAESYLSGLKQKRIKPEAKCYYGASSATMFGTSKLDSIYTFKFDSVQFNNSALNNISASTEHRAKIGFEVTNYGEVTIDYIKNRFYFNPKGYPEYKTEKVQPISYLPKDNSLIVGIIKDESLLSEIELG